MIFFLFLIDFFLYGEEVGDIEGLSGDDLLLVIVDNLVGIICGLLLFYSVYVCVKFKFVIDIRLCEI